MEKVYIDNVNIYTTYGAYITEGGHRAIFSWPPAKAVDTNDWVEQDFVEADLSSICLDVKTCSIPMAITGDIVAYRKFEAYLHSSPTHKLRFVSYGNLQYTIRVVSITGLDYYEGLTTFSIKVTCYADAYENYVYASPSSTIKADERYKLDGINLTNYGVIILDGSLGNMLSYAEMKQLLERNISTENFGEYDVNPLDTLTDGVWTRSSSAKGNVTKSSCSRTLKCLLRATATTAFGNYFALLHDLIRSDDTAVDATLAARRELTFSPAAKKIGCYYSKQTLTDLVVVGDIVWMAFDIELVITDETEI